MGEIYDYKIVEAVTRDYLIERVNDLIKSKGWQPEGGHVFVEDAGPESGQYQQTLVRRRGKEWAGGPL